MDILWSLLTLPYAPVRGLTAVVKVIDREAESRQYNPVNIRHELEELDQAAEVGDITPQERDRGQQQVLDRLTTPAGGAGRTRSDAAGRPSPARETGRRRTAVRRGGQHRGRGD
ncbi:gas vesicle protein GvpG [Micromonospora sp. NBC_00898]|uniref:gas vesicle protein GvpG n=1 Tax=Micromonospora sp. NBC_00898 TaxID=2975981 RepID=UPI00386E0834|nr:gas vesicle protein GvpG [Micromonospora sp. NBC_00898]